MSSRPRMRIIIIVVAAVLAAIAPRADAARPAAVSGELSRPGYTVIAVAANGKAASTRARGGRFRFRPPARSSTLHLRAPGGVYAGPVVVRGRGRAAVLGVRAGAKLGRISVKRGYALLTRRLAGRWVDGTFTARARKSVPIGARVFGRVRSRPPRSGVPGDRDKDGIPNPLDIDDDGDRILDNVERKAGAQAAQVRQEFAFEFNVSAPIEATANVNASGLSVATMNALLVNSANMAFDVPREGAELDCGGLPYCSPGGDATADLPAERRTLGEFPECCDPDGDGFGTITRGTNLKPHAPTDKIGTGDLFIRIPRDGGEDKLAATLQYVFASVPALASYDDGQGNRATVQYVCGGLPCPGPRPGSWENPFPVARGRGGDVFATLTFWRPQRRGIGSEPEWMDMGGLVYEVEFGSTGRDCPQDAYSTSDPSLTSAPTLPAPEGEDETGGLRDRSVDRPSSPTNTFTITVNLSRCIRARRLDHPRETWNSGETKTMNLRATDRVSYAAQGLAFKLR